MNIDYKKGKLGPKFMPPSFLSHIPQVVNYDLDPRRKFKDAISGEKPERKMFLILKEYFKKDDDVLVLCHHAFLGEGLGGENNEKDFIILNLTLGYIMLIEIKANVKKYQKSMQFFRGFCY